MLQINDKILCELTKNNTHIRELARLLGTNQTTIARKTKELQEQNIIDFKEEGKNKVFRIKDSIEAKESLKILEQKKIIEIISYYPELRIIVEKIQENEKITLAMLFGSYSSKTATDNSDIDVYVETKDVNLKEILESINSKISVKTGKFNKDNALIKEIIKNHIILKGVDKYYELIHKNIA